VTAPGLLAEAVSGQVLVQDRGRPGLAHLGVGAAGAADRSALRLANRLLANPDAAAGLEVLFGGLALRALRDVVLAVTGADVPILVRGRAVARAGPVPLAAGDTIDIGQARSGLRCYVAVRGGIVVPGVLGSRSYDTLAGLGARPLREGDALPIGPAPASFPVLDAAPMPVNATSSVVARIRLGPRLEWFDEGAAGLLMAGQWQVGTDSDRVGIRLTGPTIAWRADRGELPSEGMVRGAVQVPPNGLPVILGPDHPVTGGYPVIAVVADADIDLLSQVRPGDSMRFALFR